jgi:hypothetical protein
LKTQTQTALTAGVRSGCIGAMKIIAALLSLAIETSCTTLANRRDLYSPQPSPEIQRPAISTTATTTTTRSDREEITSPPGNR